MESGLFSIRRSEVKYFLRATCHRFDVAREASLLYEISSFALPTWDQENEVVQSDSAKGERWFCNEGEAINAGWRPSVN
jgi:hypothetical protein